MPKKKLAKNQPKAKKAKRVIRKKETPSQKKVIKVKAKPSIEAKKPEAKETKKQEWIWATGRRKTAVAQVRYSPVGTGEIKINNKMLNDYFPWFEFQQIVTTPLKLIDQLNKGAVIIRVQGGGQRSQAEAIRLGISRALQIYRPEWRPILKSAGLLTRDARIKERKKPGLKRARRAPQWSKR